MANGFDIKLFGVTSGKGSTCFYVHLSGGSIFDVASSEKPTHYGGHGVAGHDADIISIDENLGVMSAKIKFPYIGWVLVPE